MSDDPSVIDIDDATQACDVRAHHVHPDAAAAGLRHLGARGEAGREDEIQGFPGCHSVGIN